MPLVYGLYVPNAPFLISPESFGGAGTETAKAMRELRVVDRFHPAAFVVSSPHWVTRAGFRVNESARPRQVYDFSGFPPTLSSVVYEPPGDPELARALVAKAKEAHVDLRATSEWGLDHGAWAPMIHLSPGAKVPVVPLSISNLPPQAHFDLGRAMRPVLAASPNPIVFVATGSITHDFERFDPSPGARWPEGEKIEGEMLDLLATRDDRALIHFDRKKWDLVKPEGNLGPLYTLLGALGPGPKGRVVHRSSAMGGFGMSVVEFPLP